MALSATFAATRADVATALGIPQTRGIRLKEMQADVVVITKLTGDTTGSITLTGVENVESVLLFPINDSAGTANAALAFAVATFTRTNASTIAFTGLGDWTRAVALVTGNHLL